MNNELTKTPIDTAALQLKIDIEHNAIMDNLSLLVRDKRSKKGWSQAVLIEKTPLSRDAVIKLEMGRGNPELKTILAVAMTMGYKVKIDLVRQ